MAYNSSVLGDVVKAFQYTACCYSVTSICYCRCVASGHGCSVLSRSLIVWLLR